VTDLKEYQFQYRGLIFGADTDFGVESVEGIDQFRVRRADKEMPRGHGSIPGPHYLQENEIIFTVYVDRNTFEDVELGLQEFKQYFRITERFDPDKDNLVFKLPGSGTRMVRARPIGTPVERRASPGAHIIKLTVAFIVNDPRIYSDQERSNTLLPFVAGSLAADFPMQFSFNWPSGESVGGSESVIVNNGNGDAWPLIRIHGPSSGMTTRFIIQNLTYESEMAINTPLLPNQILQIDMDSIITTNGRIPITVDGDNRYSGWELPRDPLFLGPGSNVLRLTVEGDSTGITGVITWRDTSY